MGRQLGIVLVIQGDAGEGPGDGGRVAGVHLLEYDWREETRGSRADSRRVRVRVRQKEGTKG